jgi:hypothetical protein
MNRALCSITSSFDADPPCIPWGGTALVIFSPARLTKILKEALAARRSRLHFQARAVRRRPAGACECAAQQWCPSKDAGTGVAH